MTPLAGRTRAPLAPWELIRLLDGRESVDVWVLKSDLRPDRRMSSSYLIWLARRYGYALSSAISVRTTALAALKPTFRPKPAFGLKPAFRVTLVREDSPAARRRAAGTRRAYPRAGHGGPIPGLVPGNDEGGFRLAEEILCEVAAWERVLVHESLGPWSDAALSLYVLTPAALLWLAYTLWDPSGHALRVLAPAAVSAVLVLYCTALAASLRHSNRRIRQAGYVKIRPPSGPPRYASFTDLTVR